MILLKHYPVLTNKIVYVDNISESNLPDMNNQHVEKVRAYAEKEGNTVVPICAKIEEEIAQLSDKDDFVLIQLGKNNCFE